MVKKIFSIVLVVSVLFTLIACNSSSDLLKKLDELESTVQSQQNTIKDLEEKNKEQSDKITDLEEKNEEFIKEQEWLEGHWFSLKDAYYYGYITREDLMHICYFKTGKVIEGSIDDEGSWHEIDFTPQTEPPKKLSKLVEMALSTTYPCSGYFVYNYYGIYGDCIAIGMYEHGVDYAAVMVTEEIDGIIFVYSSGPFVEIMKKNRFVK